MKLNKITVLTTTAILSLCSLASCSIGGNKSTVPEEDKNKVKVTIATYQGGLGSEWITKICNELKEELADYTDDSFADGQKGVRFEVLCNTAYCGDKLTGGLASNIDIYFTEQVDYAYLVNQGIFLDITDAVTSDLSDVGDTGTIEDKLDSSFASYLSFKDGKYYGLPFYDAFYSLFYDVDMFDNNEWYKNKAGKWCGLDGDLNAGADGVEGTFDDGLPRTFAEFQTLCKYIQGTCYPIGYAGGNASMYINRYFSNIFSTYEGYDQTMLNYTLDGTANDLIDVSPTGEVTTLDPYTFQGYSDGYKIQKQAGKYYSLRFLKDNFLAANNSSSSVSTWDHITAQQYFVDTKYGANNADSKFAMLVDGTWWENEADSALTSDEIQHSNGGKMNRRFGIMPIPRVDEDHTGTKQTIFSHNSSFAFANAKTEHPELAKLIMKYFHSDKYLSRFTGYVGMTRPFNYDVSDEDLGNCSYYTKSLIDMKNDSNVVYPYSSRTEYINKPSYFSQNNFPYAYNGSSANTISAFLGTDKYSDPITYFNAMYSYAESSWNK